MNAFGDMMDEAPIAAIERKQEAAARVVDAKVEKLIEEHRHAVAHYQSTPVGSRHFQAAESRLDAAENALQEYIAEIRAPGPRPCQCGAHLPHCPLYEEGTLPLAGPRELSR